jgi:hypothetical protein
LLEGVALAKAPHGSAGKLCLSPITSVSGASPDAAAGEKPVDQKSAAWLLPVAAEADGFRSMHGPQASGGAPASEPCEDEAVFGNAGHGDDAGDELSQGSAAGGVTELKPKGSAASASDLKDFTGTLAHGSLHSLAATKFAGTFTERSPAETDSLCSAPPQESNVSLPALAEDTESQGTG